MPDGAIYLVDEIEAGLEPHRIRHLLRKFISLINVGGTTQGKVIMTSHSSVAIAELEAECLCVIRSYKGTTTADAISKELQDTVRSVADAFLARKVLVCEGATEYGMTRSFDEYWESKGNDSFAFVGLISVDGRGEKAPRRSLELAKLGYDTALFIDSDKITTITPAVADLTAAGVKVFHWAGTVATEQEVFNCIPWEGVEELLKYACLLKGEESVYDAICNVLAAKRTEVAPDLRDHFDETVLRTTIGTVAKKQSWYKSVGKGQVFGNFVLPYLDKIPDSTLSKTIQQIHEWIYAE